MKRFSTILLMLMLIVVFGCQEASETPPMGSAAKMIDYAAIKAQLAREQQQYADAWCNQDMNAIGEIWSHDDDITIWNADPRARIQGWEGPNGVKALYQNSFDSMETIDFKISDVLVKVAKSGTAAVVTYYVENDFVDNDGKKGKGTPRVTVVRELIDGKWKTIHGDASFSISEIKAMK
ncbi:YybH family protein [Candidatus Omnitrophota bacterium]